MSRFNPAHARLFTGVVTHATASHAPLLRSHVVELVRFADDRARVQLGHEAQLDLHPQVGERFEFDAQWGDGGLSVAVDITAVHRDGFVDVRGVELDSKPTRVRLRRYPQSRGAR